MPSLRGLTMDTTNPVEAREHADVRPPVVEAAKRRDLQTRRRWSSVQLLGDQHEIEIAHADSVYRLRVTSLGKLILTK